jgi:tetratricopeptide (TPR) repeat protein
MAEADHESSRLEQFRELIDLDPDDYFSRFGYGSALFDAGRYSEAVLEFRAAIRLKPDYSALPRSWQSAREERCAR